MKRFKKTFALMAAGALLLGSVGTAAATDGYTSIAGTDLHASQVGSDSTTFAQDCEGAEVPEGSVLWHFVLVQTTALNTGVLRAEFEDAGVTVPDVAYTKFVGGVVHWNVITPGDDVLLNASTDAVGAILNLSHVCGGGDEESHHTYLRVRKFYDFNANGVYDAGDSLLTGWKVDINGTAAYTPYDEEVAPDTYVVTEYFPVETNWVNSGSAFEGTNIDASVLGNNQVSITLGPDDDSTAWFGNYCTVPSGGLTMGFWSNKNGQALITAGDLAFLRGLNLVNGTGVAFDPTTAAQVKSFLLSSNATNMAYMLSAQLLAMELNVRHGKVDAAAYVVGYGTISALMDAANTSLGLHPATFSGSSDRSAQETLKNFLDRLNNGGAVVPVSPCTFTFS